MRVATFNILHGRTVGDGVDLDHLRASVQRLDADVLALQEVDFEQERSGRADLTAVAAELWGRTSIRRVRLGHAGCHVDGGYGCRTTGHGRLQDRAVIAIPGDQLAGVAPPRVPFRFPIYLPGSDRLMVVHEEPRVAAIARLDTSWGPITFANTHLSFVPGSNRRQLRRQIDHILTDDARLEVPLRDPVHADLRSPAACRRHRQGVTGRMHKTRNRPDRREVTVRAARVSGKARLRSRSSPSCLCRCHM